MTKKNIDLSTYFILDPACCTGRQPVEIAEAALKGGVTMLQYRDKKFIPSPDYPNLTVFDNDSLPLPEGRGIGAQRQGEGDLKENALKLQKRCREYNVPFIINDHVELAAEINADGIHIGQGDMAPQEARKLIGSNKILGLTAFTEEHLQAVDPDIVDYVGTGPVYPTQTDKGKPVLGVERFAELVKLSPVPVVGIGGITPENAAPVRASGAAGVAMMRAISEALDPTLAAQAFGRITDEHR